MKTSRDKPDKPTGKQERLKAALKANMGRRKAQARARADAKPQSRENEQKE